jgi:hypothetical protein
LARAISSRQRGERERGETKKKEKRRVREREERHVNSQTSLSCPYVFRSLPFPLQSPLPTQYVHAPDGGVKGKGGGERGRRREEERG